MDLPHVYSTCRRIYFHFKVGAKTVILMYKVFIWVLMYKGLMCKGNLQFTYSLI